ncbi:HNH endonuclease [Streptococcus thermophilus]|nr:HNH endonuclease [Streptococcus thermophilus]MDA5537984.1 HNH endonuclease [Streptococcus thermophilus]MDA5552503.1 HNH endonuclease [Streptococcus thermophilus]WCL60757.1 HNH endonuclease [Streptococcus thermophilus]
MEAAYIEERQTYSRTRYNKRVRNRDDESKERYAFYRSRTWSSIRKIALERDSYLCQYCLTLGTVTPDSRIGDHVTPVEIAPEIKTDINNVVATCRSCDNTKRTLEQDIYGTGQNRIKQNTDLRLSVSSWAGLIDRKKKDVVKHI